MRKYKVLHITNYLDMSGAQENTLFTVSNLNQDRFAGHIAANLWGGDRKLDSVLARRALEIPHLTVHDLPHIRFWPHPIHDPLMLFDMIRLIRREKFDVVHTHANKVGILGRIAAWLSGVPVIVHGVHGWSFQYDLAPKIVTGFFLLLEKIAARITHHFVTVNDALVRDGLQSGLGKPEQYTVVRSGMNLDRFTNVQIDSKALREELGIPEDRLIVGTVMLFYTRKSPQSIIEIAPQILQAAPNTHFLLVGDGEMMPTVKALVEELDLSNHVTVTGLRDDPQQMMTLMDVFVHPALMDVLPRVIIQAMATGTAVVSTEVGGVPEVITNGENGVMVPVGNLEAMAEAIIRLLQDKNLRTQIGQAAADSTSTAYSIEAMVATNEQVYNTLLAANLGHTHTTEVAV